MAEIHNGGCLSLALTLGLTALVEVAGLLMVATHFRSEGTYYLLRIDVISLNDPFRSASRP
jgi:hypothetical protein